MSFYYVLTLPFSAINPQNRGEGFGHSVDVDGNLALIGSFADWDNPSLGGSAFLFDLSSGTILQKFVPPHTFSEIAGFPVALDGNYAIVTKTLDLNYSRRSNGSVYLFDTTNGDLLHRFVTPDIIANGDFFASSRRSQSVALSGNHVLIGSYGDDERGDNSGSAYLFDTETGGLLHEFLAPDGAASDQFGYSVALHNDYAVITSRSDRNDSGKETGSVYLFDVTSGDFIQKFVLSEEHKDRSHAQFGKSLALYGNHILISDVADNTYSSGGRTDNRGVNSGAAYVYTIDGGQENPEKIPEPSAVAGLILMGGLASLKRLSKQR